MPEGVSLDFSRLTLLISHDRSGSHYLGSFVRSLPDHWMIDEICNEQALDPASDPISFFGFRHRRAAENPDYGLRRRTPIVTALLDEYFSFVLAQSSGRNVVIDIKYGHVHNFEIAWWPIFRRPFLFEYAQLRRIKMIHLHRWNSVETVVSGEVAESRRLWHSTGDKPQASDADAVMIDRQKLLEQVTLLNEQKDAFSKWMRSVKNLSILYEELTNDASKPECLARIAKFLGTDAPASFASPYRKVTPPLPRIVRNWPEVAKFCRENGLGQYLLALRSQ